MYTYTYHTYHVYKYIYQVYIVNIIYAICLYAIKTTHRIHMLHIHDVWITGLYHIYIYTPYLSLIPYTYTTYIYRYNCTKCIRWYVLKLAYHTVFPDPHINPAMKHQMISRKAAPLNVGSPKDTVLSSDPGIPNPWVAGVVTLGFHRNSVKPRPLYWLWINSTIFTHFF